MKRSDLDWSWDRAIYINRDITDEFVSELLPQILSLKEKSSDPITVGIDSVGGSVHSTKQLLEVIRSPDQNGNRPKVITVAINKAFSAAASLLTLGDYAVAMPSAQILFHDVRYGEVRDLTPMRAAKAASDLSLRNDELALILARRVIERLTWLFIDQSERFQSAKEQFPDMVEAVGKLGLESVLQEGTPRLDLAGFICSIYEQTSSIGDTVLDKSIERLQKWRALEVAYTAFNDRNKPDQQQQALFRDDNPLIAIVNQNHSDLPAFTWSSRKPLKDELALLLLLALDRAATDPAFRINSTTVADVLRDSAFFRELREEHHLRKVIEIVFDNDLALFGIHLPDKKDVKDAESHSRLIYDLCEQVQVLWAFTLVMCRSLLNGEHILSLNDALYLGLVDEVAGVSKPEPLRLFRRKSLARKAAAIKIVDRHAWCRNRRK